MSEEQIKVEELPENCQVLEVPDDVYVTNNGKYYYPYPTAKAKIKIDLQEAEDKGIKPSKVYMKFLNELAIKESKK